MEHLSRDVIYCCIAPHLSPISLARLSAVSTRFFHLLRNHPDLKRWKENTQTQTVDRCLREAAIEGDRELVEFFIEKGATEWDWGLQSASKGGHRELVEFFIGKGATDWNWALYGASKGGHRELVEFFIEEKGATNWHGGLVGAASEGGHPELVEFFFEKIKENS